MTEIVNRELTLLLERSAGMRKRLLEVIDFIGMLWCRSFHDEEWDLPTERAYQCKKCWRKYAYSWAPWNEIPPGVWHTRGRKA